MKMKLKYISVIVFALCPYLAKSQDNAMYFLRSLPQNNSINASEIPEGKGYIGFPLLSSFQFDYYNSGFALKDILIKGSGLQQDTLVINNKGFSDAIDRNNVFFQEVSNTWLSGGLKIKKAYISFALNSRLKSKTFYPGTIGDWFQGNYDYQNDKTLTLTTQGLSQSTITYNEFVIGYAQPIGEKFTVGVRLKYIMGIANMNVNRFNISLNTLSSTEMQINTDAEIQTNIPLDVTYDSINHVKNASTSSNASITKMLFDNKGFGIDLGVTYKPIQRLSLGLAINDLGFISWKSYPHKFISNSTYNYSGTDLSDMFGGKSTSTDYWRQMTDSIKNSFKFTADSTAYKTGLQGNIIITGNFRMLSWLDLGAMLKTQFYQGKPYPGLGLACGMSPFKQFSSTLTYSMRKGSYFNIGTGLAYKPGPVQFYLVTDNLPNAFALKSAKAINFRFGINFLFGTGNHSKDTQTTTN